MVIIPKEYYKEEKNIKLTKSEIDLIIDELERAEHNIFLFLNYGKIIEKLKNANNTKNN